MPETRREVVERMLDDNLPYRIVEEMGLGLTFRSCACGQLPCARLRPIRDALEAVRRDERERCARAICLFCAEPEHYGLPKEIEGSKRLWHDDLRNDCNGVVQCQAATIRNEGS